MDKSLEIMYKKYEELVEFDKSNGGNGTLSLELFKAILDDVADET